MIKFKKVAIGIGSLGMKTYDLLDPSTGESVPFYAEYLHKKTSDQVANRRQSQNTIDAIAFDLKVFLEYVSNAQAIFFAGKVGTATTLLADIILSYPDYLTLGPNAQKPIARETALFTGHKPIGVKSAERYLSSVNGFVEASAMAHERLKEAQELGLINIDVPSENIYKNLLQRRDLSTSERNRLQQQSVLSQVVCGGARYTKTRLFRIQGASSSTSSNYKYFPPSHIQALLSAAQSYRDRALWALLLGAGLRMSEAAQLLVTDANIVNDTLKVLTYRDRVNCFEGVKIEDTAKLSFKGRETEDAYFIEPFGKVFFESITLYLKHERPRGLEHNYLFVTNSNRSRGRPLFATSRSNRNAPIKTAQTAIDCPLKSESGRQYTLHSLRHFYGYWLLNFHLTPEGERFSLLEVQHMMGHAQISSTKKYAVIDKIVAKEKMRLANLVLQNKSATEDENLLVSHQRDVLKALTSGINR